MSFENPLQSTTTEGYAEQRSPQEPPAHAPAADMSTTQTTPSSPTEPSIVASASAPEVMITSHTLNAASVVFSPSLDISLLQSSRTPSSEALSASTYGVGEGSSVLMSSEPDVQILEALRSKDRLWVLKLGEMMETLINERKQPRLDLQPATTYQRMLIHKCSAYHRLTSETDASTKITVVSIRSDSRIPQRRIAELVPLEESAQPAFKIMRRSPQDRRVRQNSHPGSAAGDEGDLSDVEPSEAGSSGGRSNATGTAKRPLTLEEREAAYNEARSRIFMGFEEKDKEKDASANSSTFSLTSGSGSASGADDSASSAATESEWSGPATRDKREGRRGGSAGSSSRSFRSGYNQSGSNSSRHSRAASPSSYPSLYDPAAGTFDTAYGSQGPPHGYIQYYYGYPPVPTPGHGPAAPFVPQYGYGYPPYGYPQHPPSHPHSDPVTPGEPMYPHTQSPTNMPYPPNPYMWPPPPPGPSSHQASKATSPAAVAAPLPGALQHGQPMHLPQPMQQQGYPGYYTPQYPPYPVSGYYPPPYAVPPGQTPPPPSQMQGQYYPDAPYGSEYQGHGHEFGPDSVDHSRASSRNSNHHGSMNGNRRGGPARRQAWSYGPGIGMGGPPTGDFVGPRLNSRRTSSGSQSAGYRTPGDEASSVTSSSTTSSSSQRTFTSTSSKHPLPARPDWAVGLKAQPTLSATRHHDANSRNMSPARIGGNLPHHRPQQQPPALTDFPPLSSAAPEKKTPVVGGAWQNSSNMRSALKAGPSGTPPAGTAPVNHPNANASTGRLEEQDRAFERPPPKGNTELFNPRQHSGTNGNGATEACGTQETTADALAERVQGMSLAANGLEVPLTASPTPNTPPGEV